ncbi:hypothetical protein NPIL_685051 [Nephila pilipes]|uniref:Uncharacterized protein n=1 Tax=Nephila pilipes TaxID=299642 RepID=A0A8X6PDZ9_NEPPI|nr:hypothetical protein NPIL_685051 [Nephila pilipes]
MTKPIATRKRLRRLRGGEGGTRRTHIKEGQMGFGNTLQQSFALALHPHYLDGREGSLPILHHGIPALFNLRLLKGLSFYQSR